VSTEDRLRQALAQRAAEARPSPDGWDRIAARLEPAPRSVPRAWRPRPVLLAAAAVVAVVALVAALAVRDDDGRRQVVAGPDPTGSTVLAVPPPGPGFPGIWPESDAPAYALADVRVGDGVEAWRADPVAVARAYAEDVLGRESVTTGPFEAFDLASGQVSYEVAGGERGQVLLARPGRAWVVREATLGRRVEAVPRGHGTPRGVDPAGALADPFVLDVRTTAPGALVARVGPFDSEWVATDEREVVAGTSEVHLDLPEPLLAAALVRVELEADRKSVV
jgi:hypothetical protein